jgi:hypothetical protein
MSDSYFDADRATGEYPRKDYNRQNEAEKRIEITRKINSGWRLPWVLKEAEKMGIPVPTE